MMSVPARQPPQDHGDAGAAGIDTTENGARSGAIAVQAVIAANRADADDAAQYISAPPAESGGGNDGCAVVSPVQDSQDRCCHHCLCRHRHRCHRCCRHRCRQHFRCRFHIAVATGDRAGRKADGSRGLGSGTRRDEMSKFITHYRLTSK
jgi:hypothetical protein